MSTYQINFSDGTTALMILTNEADTVEAEVAKWGSPIMHPVDPANPLGPQQAVTVTGYTLITS